MVPLLGRDLLEPDEPRVEEGHQDVHVPAGGEAHHPEAVGEGVHDPQHVRADGASGAENREAFHGEGRRHEGPSGATQRTYK